MSRLLMAIRSHTWGCVKDYRVPQLQKSCSLDWKSLIKKNHVALITLQNTQLFVWRLIVKIDFFLILIFMPFTCTYFSHYEFFYSSSAHLFSHILNWYIFYEALDGGGGMGDRGHKTQMFKGQGGHKTKTAKGHLTSIFLILRDKGHQTKTGKGQGTQN